MPSNQPLPNEKPPGQVCIECEKEELRKERITKILKRLDQDVTTKNAAYAKDVENGPLPAGKWKCNLYVNDVVERAGFHLPDRTCGTKQEIENWLTDSNVMCPPVAGELGEGKLANGALIPGLKQVTDPLPGDIIVQKQQFDDASGHSGFVKSYDPQTKTGVMVSAGAKDVHENVFHVDKGYLGSDGKYHGPLVFQRIE